MITEAEVIQSIVLGNDWQDVLTNLIVEEGMDPKEVDIIKLTDTFVKYIERLKKFDFRIPARFILIAAILLRMKAELLLEEEEQRVREHQEHLPKISLENMPDLAPPIKRQTTRKVTLGELIGALEKAFDFKERKEERGLRMRRAVENLIDKEEDIEGQITRVFEQILKKGNITFTELVPVWKPKEIVDTFLPLLYLCQRGKVSADQEEMFKEIYIKVR